VRRDGILYVIAAAGLDGSTRGASDVQGQGRPKVPGHATATVAVVDSNSSVVIRTRQLAGAQEVLGMRWRRDEGWRADREIE
jgi:hypothetical protein